MAMTKRRWMTPEEFSDEDMGSLPRSVRFTALALRMWADDGGRARLNARSVKGAIFANDLDLTIEELEEDLLRLSDVGFLRMYEAGGRWYYAIADRFHVAPDKSKGSDLPPPPVQTPSGWHRDAGPIEERGRAETGEPERDPSRPDPDDDTMPPAFCPDHMPRGSGGAPCVRCRDARLVHEAETRRRRQETRWSPAPEDDESERD